MTAPDWPSAISMKRSRCMVDLQNELNVHAARWRKGRAIDANGKARQSCRVKRYRERA